MSLEAHFSMRQWSCFVKRRRRKWKKDLKQSWLPAFWKKDQRHTKGYTEFSLIKQNKRGCHFSDVLYSYIFLLFVKICQGIRLRISAWHDMIHDKAVQTFSKNAFFKAEQSSLYWWYVSRRWAMLIDPSSSSFFFWGVAFLMMCVMQIHQSGTLSGLLRSLKVWEKWSAILKALKVCKRWIIQLRSLKNEANDFLTLRITS